MPHLLHKLKIHVTKCHALCHTTLSPHAPSRRHAIFHSVFSHPTLSFMVLSHTIFHIQTFKFLAVAVAPSHHFSNVGFKLRVFARLWFCLVVFACYGRPVGGPVKNPQKQDMLQSMSVLELCNVLHVELCDNDLNQCSVTHIFVSTASI